MTGLAPALAQESTLPAPLRVVCGVDLQQPGSMNDIVSNALLRGVRRPEADVRAFLRNAETRYATGQDLLRDAARHFKVTEARLVAEVERFHHCNCEHALAPIELTPFARDVTLHVVLHELGHALIREFDLPVLGNEETMADAFATHYLVTHLPKRAVDVLSARVTSLMIEANDVPREQWAVGGEHDSDARRAFQIAALAVAADATKYARVATIAGMSSRDVQRARDYGAEIHRSWRRILTPLWMPDAVPSQEARIVLDPAGEFFAALTSTGLAAELESVVRRFDWHSQVTVHFVRGTGGAAWNRSKRTVTVESDYLHRFIVQGKVAEH